jgi:hypothetical protein
VASEPSSGPDARTAAGPRRTDTWAAAKATWRTNTGTTGKSARRPTTERSGDGRWDQPQVHRDRQSCREVARRQGQTQTLGVQAVAQAQEAAAIHRPTPNRRRRGIRRPRRRSGRIRTPVRSRTDIRNRRSTRPEQAAEAEQKGHAFVWPWYRRVRPCLTIPITAFGAWLLVRHQRSWATVAANSWRLQLRCTGEPSPVVSDASGTRPRIVLWRTDHDQRV